MYLSIYDSKIISFSRIVFQKETNDNEIPSFTCNSEDDDVPSGLISFY